MSLCLRGLSVVRNLSDERRELLERREHPPVAIWIGNGCHTIAPGLVVSRFDSPASLSHVFQLAIHVVDDNFLQPEPGTTARDHLLSGLLPVGLLVAVAVAYIWLLPGLRAICSLLIGAFGLAATSEAVYYTSEVGASGDDFTGWLCLPAGLALVGLGVVTLWRSRKRTGRMWVRVARRTALSPRAVHATKPWPTASA